MPLLRIDVIKGRSSKELKAMLDAIHRGMVSAFDVPERDRYQIVNEHSPEHMIVQDTGLDIPRTDQVIVIQVISRQRTLEKKKAFYENVCRELEAMCGTKSSDVMVSIVENTDEDWSFGYGRGQFLTGEL